VQLSATKRQWQAGSMAAHLLRQLCHLPLQPPNLPLLLLYAVGELQQ
jgi:hypothetical protein